MKESISQFTNQNLNSMWLFCRKSYFSLKMLLKKFSRIQSRFTMKCIKSFWRYLREFKNNSMKRNFIWDSIVKTGPIREDRRQANLGIKVPKKEAKGSEKAKEKEMIRKYFLEIKTLILFSKLWSAYKCQFEVLVVSRKSSLNNPKTLTLSTHSKWIMAILDKMTFFTPLLIMHLTFLII